MRGVTAQELHGILRHYYVMVSDLIIKDSRVSPKKILFEKTNQFKYPGIVHVVTETGKEIDRFQV